MAAKLFIDTGSQLFYKEGFSVFRIKPRVVTNVYRDGSNSVVYDLDQVDETMRVVRDYGTYFSVEDAIEKCKSLTRKDDRYERNEGF